MGAAIAKLSVAKCCGPELCTGDWLRMQLRGVEGGHLPPRKRFQWGRTGGRAGLLFVTCLA